MSDFFGTLFIQGATSRLLPQDAILLLAGFPDVNQAIAAATSFIQNTKGIGSGTQVHVTGGSAVVGQQPVIVMNNIAPFAH